MSTYEQIYTTTAVNTGGRNGVSYIDGGTLEVVVQTPKELGGKGEATNPEQLFALGYAACFNGALEVVLGQENIHEKALVSNTVRLLRVPDELDFKLEVEIQVAIANQTADRAQHLAERAHQICPYSKAVQGNINVYVKGVEYDASKEK